MGIRKPKVAQLSLLDGLPSDENHLKEKGARVRFTFDDRTTKRLDELTNKDRIAAKKKGHKGNWYPKDTLKAMIDERYEQLQRWGK